MRYMAFDIFDEKGRQALKQADAIAAPRRIARLIPVLLAAWAMLASTPASACLCVGYSGFDFEKARNAEIWHVRVVKSYVWREARGDQMEDHSEALLEVLESPSAANVGGELTLYHAQVDTNASCRDKRWSFAPGEEIYLLAHPDWRSAALTPSGETPRYEFISPVCAPKRHVTSRTLKRLRLTFPEFMSRGRAAYGLKE